MKNARSASLPKLLDQLLGVIRDAASTRQTPDDLSFVMCDREFVQRTHRTCDEQHDIARPHQHDVPSFQTKSGIDNRVARIKRQLVQLDVLNFVTCRRDTDVETARVVRCLTDDVHDSRSRAGKEYDVACRDGARQSLSFLDQSTARLQSRTLGRC